MMGATRRGQHAGGASNGDYGALGGPSTDGEAGADADGDALSADAVFEALSNERRRYAVAYLLEADEDRVRVRDLSEHIAARENGVPVAEVTYKERKRVYTSLYQLHLEKLDRLGVVRYDQGAGTVERTPALDDLRGYLGPVDDRDADCCEGPADDARVHGAFALAVVCGVGVAAAWAGLLPIPQGAGLAVALGVASVFGLVTGAQVVDDWRDRR